MLSLEQRLRLQFKRNSLHDGAWQVWSCDSDVEEECSQFILHMFGHFPRMTKHVLSIRRGKSQECYY